VEGLDQTRGWFYTLLVLSTALFDKKPANNIMAVGLILDENRKKISKKTKNYVDPLILIERYGADSIRLYLLQSHITNAEPLAFKEEDIKIINKTLFQFKNCVDFLMEHITNQKHQQIQFDILAYQRTTNPMDKWIMQHMNNIQSQVIEYMDKYQITRATRIIIELVEDITNWYLKFNRDRLKGKLGKSNADEWIISTSVLYQVIRQYVILLAPFAPFISESIYYQLNPQITLNNSATSARHSQYKFVHFEKYNEKMPIELFNDGNNYLETFELLKRVSKLVRNARMKTTTHSSSKTPIKSCEICMDSAVSLEQITSCIDLIQSELNVIDIKYSSLAGKFCYRIVPNQAILGKKYRQKANEIYRALERQEQELQYVDNNLLKQFTLYIPLKDTGELIEYVLLEDEFTLQPLFNPNDIYDIGVQNNNILVRIDFTYDSQIEKLSHLKRFVSEIQQTRKYMGLKPWNKIAIHIYEDDFDIVYDKVNMEYIMKRLECDVIFTNRPSGIINPSSLKYYQQPNDNDNNNDIDIVIDNVNIEEQKLIQKYNKKIVYAVILL